MALLYDRIFFQHMTCSSPPPGYEFAKINKFERADEPKSEGTGTLLDHFTQKVPVV